MYDPKVFPVFFMFLKQTAHQKTYQITKQHETFVCGNGDPHECKQ